MDLEVLPDIEDWKFRCMTLDGNGEGVEAVS